MAGKKKVQYFSDFTGGLNFQNEIQDLAMNESPDLQDVDLNPHGGFVVRNGLKHLYTATAPILDDGSYGEPRWAYLLGQVSLGTDCVIGVSESQRLFSWDGSTFTHATGALTDDTNQYVNYATWNGKLYLSNCWSAGTLVARRRSGATFGTATTLTNAWNNDYTAPAGGNMPLARLVANHSGHMWVADTIESSTRYRHRLRWSHPLQGEDWAEADYFDIDNRDQSDAIVALVPFTDRLLVFKRRSVWAVFGYDRESFVVEQIAGAAGTINQRSVTSSADTVFWWSPDGNVMAYNGSQFTAIGDNISTLYKNRSITASGLADLCWADDRLWVVLADPATSVQGVYVFDPTLSKRGAWTYYFYAITSLVAFKPVTGNNQIIGLGYGSLYNLADPNQEQDEFTSGVLTPITTAYYKTSWFSGGDTALKKAFKRLHMTAASKEEGSLLVDVFMDFNADTPTRTLTLDFANAAGGMEWGTSSWGEASWGAVDSQYEFDRLQSAGRGHAIQFKFRFPTSASRWWVDSFTLPYIEKFYR